MMRSLYSGVSGLRVHQTKMDVIGNNISNVNTVGFKASSVTFSDILYQTSAGASGPNADRGTAGTNAKQIGLGANLASITTAITKTGGSQRTDNPFDIMIEGDSFFVVNNGSGNFFTKAGSFNVDGAGNLCTPSGAIVMGWQPNPADPYNCVRDTVSALKIMSPENMFSAPEATSNVHLTGNIDSKDTDLTTGGVTVNVPFYDNIGNKYNAVVKITKEIEEDTAELSGNYVVRVADITGEEGNSIFIQKATDEEGNVTYSHNQVYQGFSFYAGDSATEIGAEVDENGNLNFLEEGVQEGVILSFDPATGRFAGVGDGDAADGGALSSIKLGINCSPNPFMEIDIDFSSLTQYNQSGNTSIEPIGGSLENRSGAGKRAGSMAGISVDSEGRIYGSYDNGDSKLLGQIAVATFANAAGLEAIGNNMFRTTSNSGEFDGIGQNIKSTGGKFNTGVLEMSNVDLSQEFTDMITTQRGFQANSRIITTSDTLLEELINLKR